MTNRMYVEFDSVSDNEAFARVTVAAFITRLDPTLEEIEDVKTAVSEAVTNAIIHGYQNKEGIISMECLTQNQEVTVIIKDKGVGIENVEQAMEPLFTTREEEERSGMGFSFMEIFMDSLVVESKPGEGTTIIMKKTIGNLY
ncbi:MAG: anti-sigma F factor [Lachnospiraceae bacterium]|nr:anti-sigma F factor [Lachnospiraceae bacterium]